MTLLDKEQKIRPNNFFMLQSHFQNRRLVSKNGENRAPSAECRPTSEAILAIFWLADDFFCRSTEVKSFVDRSNDFQEFCRRWNVGRWSPDDRPTFWRNSYHDIGRRLPDRRASIGRLSPDGPSVTFDQRPVGRQTPDIGRHSADDRPTVGLL